MGVTAVGATGEECAGRGRSPINIARFDLVSMRLAVLCADTGSLKAAARSAHLSTSAGSQRLTALEGRVGAPLFLRERRGLQPTEFGRVFVEHARTVLSHLEALVLHVADATEDYRRMRVGAGQQNFAAVAQAA